MARRVDPHRWICAAAALVLLVTLMSSPFRPKISRAHRLGAGFLRRNESLPPHFSNRFAPTLPATPLTQIKAIRTGDDEETRGERVGMARPIGSLVDPRPWAMPTQRPPIYPPHFGSTPPLRC